MVKPSPTAAETRQHHFMCAAIQKAEMRRNQKNLSFRNEQKRPELF